MSQGLDMGTLENAIIRTRSQVSEPSGIAETALSPELIKEQRRKAVRAIMWLSADMKNWLDGYGQESEKMAIKVQERPINSKLKRYDDMLTLFGKLLDLDKLAAQEQLDLVADWRYFRDMMQATPDKEYFEIFQQLDEQSLDSQEFIDELKAFKHDLMSPTGGSGVVSEYGMILKDSGYSPLVETANKLNYNFLNVKKMLNGILDAKVDKETVLTPQDSVQTIINLRRVLDTFNIESGGEISGEVPASEVWSFILEVITMLDRKFDKLTITKDNKLEKEDESKLVKLNKSVIFRLLLNTISNSQKGNPAGHVVVTLASSSESVVVAVSDDGVGFPTEELDSARVILDKPVKLYKVSEGKTSWKSATGTGNGLFGLSNVANRLGGELVTGNYYEGDQRQGALIALVIPYTKS